MEESEVLRRLDELAHKLESGLNGVRTELGAKLESLESGLNDVRGDLAAITARTDLIKEAIDSLADQMEDAERFFGAKWLEHDREIVLMKRRIGRSRP